MPFSIVRSLLVLALAGATAAQSSPAPAGQPPPPNIAGIWVLNPALTQKPDEIGFNAEWAKGAEGEDGGRSGGGRGRRGGGRGWPQISRESADDSVRVQQLSGEARTPPAHITIVQKASTVSIADDQGHSRTFHPDGSLDELTIGTTALPARARWDAGSLVVVYEVGTGRQLRYTFTPAANPGRLL